MKVLAGLALLILVGCQGVTVAEKTPAPDQTEKVVAPPEPNTAPGSRITLALWDKTLKVGDTDEQAEAMLPEVSRRHETNDLPPGFGKGYRARVWQRADASLGIILFNSKVVAGLATLEKLDAIRQEEIVAQHRAAAGEPTDQIQSTHVTYWFWEEGGQRLMICAYRPKDGEVKLTLAMGDAGVLDVLRISPQAARDDSARVDEILVPKTGAPQNL